MTLSLQKTLTKQLRRLMEQLGTMVKPSLQLEAKSENMRATKRAEATTLQSYPKPHINTHTNTNDETIINKRR